MFGGNELGKIFSWLFVFAGIGVVATIVSLIALATYVIMHIQWV